MAIRELITEFSFKTDLAGLNDYNRALDKTKAATEKAFDTSKLTAGLEKLSGVAFKLTNMMGLTFAMGAMDQLANKAMDYVKEIFNGSKEIKRLNSQLELVVGNTAQASKVQETLFSLAQKTGMEYKDILEMSQGILVAGKEQNVPIEKTTDAISNMVLALKTGKANAQQTAEAVGSLEQAVRMGKIGPRTIGRLIQAPGLGQFLADQLSGGDLGKLRAKVKAGLNIKDLLEGLAKPNAELNAKVAKLPFTIARAFTMIKNDMTAGVGEIMKLAAGFGGLGKIVFSAFSFAKSATLGFINALGGLKNTIELVGYALAIALGPLLIRNIVLATVSLVEMAVASWAVWAPWLAIGIAVGVAALAIQDFMLWMESSKNKTVLGDMLGPFDDFKKSIEDFPLVKMVTGLKEIFTGDFGKGFASIKEGFASISTPAEALLTTVGLIGGAFIAWKTLEFVGIIGALGKLAAAFKPVQVEAAAATTAIQRVENAAHAPGAPAATTPAVTPGARPGRTPVKKAVIGAGIALPFVLDATLLAQQAGIVPKASEPMQDRLTTAATGSSLGAAIGAGIGLFFGGAGAAPGSAIGGAIGGIGGFVWPEIKQAGDLLSQTATVISDFAKKSGVTIQNTNPSAEQAGVPQSGAAQTTLPIPVTQEDIPPAADLFKWLRDAVTSGQDAVPTMRQPVTQEDLPAPGTQAPTKPIVMPFPSESSLVPQVMPFDSMGGGGPKTVENTVNAGGISPTYNITVTAQMNEEQVAAAVKAQVSAQAPDLLDRVSRQISDAMPRTEKAAA